MIWRVSLSFLQHDIKHQITCWELISFPEEPLLVLLNSYSFLQASEAMPVNKLWKVRNTGFLQISIPSRLRRSNIATEVSLSAVPYPYKKSQRFKRKLKAKKWTQRLLNLDWYFWYSAVESLISIWKLSKIIRVTKYLLLNSKSLQLQTTLEGLTCLVSSFSKENLLNTWPFNHTEILASWTDSQDYFAQLIH